MLRPTTHHLLKPRVVTAGLFLMGCLLIPGTSVAGLISSYNVSVTLPNLKSLYNAVTYLPSSLVDNPVTINSTVTFASTATPGQYTFTQTPVAGPFWTALGTFSPSNYSTFATTFLTNSTYPNKILTNDPIYSDFNYTGYYKPQFQLEWGMPQSGGDSLIPGVYPINGISSTSPFFVMFSYQPAPGNGAAYGTSMTIIQTNQTPVPVPAPAAWLMMLTGLGILIPLYRRHIKAQRRGVDGAKGLAV